MTERTLYQQVRKLAATTPETRKHLIPLLKKYSALSTRELAVLVTLHLPVLLRDLQKGEVRIAVSLRDGQNDAADVSTWITKVDGWRDVLRKILGHKALGLDVRLLRQIRETEAAMNSSFEQGDTRQFSRLRGDVFVLRMKAYEAALRAMDSEDY